MGAEVLRRHGIDRRHLQQLLTRGRVTEFAGYGQVRGPRRVGPPHSLTSDSCVGLGGFLALPRCYLGRAHCPKSGARTMSTSTLVLAMMTPGSSEVTITS
jgi:hypothetical protein